MRGVDQLVRLASSLKLRLELALINPIHGLGTMMNEIGLAQQRLFDDEDAQRGSARSGLPDGYDATNESDDGHIAPQQPEIQIQSTTPPGSYVSLPPPYGPNHEYTDNPDTHQQAPAPVNHSIDFPSYGYDHTQSATSYNIFESSLRPSESTYSENNTTLKSHQTIPTEAIQRSPRRWNSTQGTISSPHDTEPNSSILAAQASRSKSDNNSSSNGVQQPATGVGEISLPVETEAPVGKKRGRPKKQSLPDVDESKEPQLPENHATDQPPVSEKRKPGRPPKNAKNHEANGNTVNSEPDAENVPSLAEEPKTTEVPEQIDDTFQFQVPAHPKEIESKPSDPAKTKKSKEPAKKKLKRGKTTSVTLQKTYESDVEDDVIWVESRPSNADAAAPEETSAAPFSINIEAPAPQKTEDTTETKQTDPAPDQAPATAEPAPKKRGRKRKKTSEQALAPQAEPEPEPTEQPNPNPDPNDTHTRSDPQAEPEDHTASTGPQPAKDPEPEPEPDNPPVTPQKPEPKTPSTAAGKPSTRGPDKHSPISSTSKVPYRVGLSRRARIAPLLKIVKR